MFSTTARLGSDARHDAGFRLGHNVLLPLDPFEGTRNSLGHEEAWRSPLVRGTLGTTRRAWDDITFLVFQ